MRVKNKKNIYKSDSNMANMSQEMNGKASIINSSHIFVDDAARDVYFTANPTEKVENLLISVGDGFQEWSGTAWISKTKVVEDHTLKVELVARGITCTQLGMVVNDNNEGVNNANKLSLGLKNYGTVIVDNVYYLKAPSSAVAEGDIEIYGIKGGEFRFNHTSSTVMFNPMYFTSIKLKNLKMTNESVNSVLFFYGASDLSIHLTEVSVEGCSFNGSISLYRHSGPENVNPYVTFYGIDRFVFKNNVVNNTTLSFITLEDVPIPMIICEGNTIKNFSHTFLSVGTTNGLTYGSQIGTIRRMAEIKNNYVYNDNTWFTADTVYHTFFLYEGFECKYEGNHVEGLKSIYDDAVYDAYISCETLIYMNNTWKNNICFNATKTNNVLLKSKGSGTGGLLKRYYKNNVYIVEEGYAAAVGQDITNLRVAFMSLTSDCEEYVVENNTFDVYDLRFDVSGNPHRNFKLLNNKFKCKYTAGSMVICTISDTQPIENIIIKGNTIQIAEATTSKLNIVKMSDTRVVSTILPNIVVEDNYIDVPIFYVFYTLAAKKLIFRNNMIITNTTGSIGLMYSGFYNESLIDNNIVESLLSTSFYEGRQNYGSGYKYEKIMLIRTCVSDANNCLNLRFNHTTTTRTYYKRKYKVYTNTGIKEFYYRFSLIYNIDHCDITFIDTTDIEHTYAIGTSEGTGTYIKLINIGDETNTYTVRFNNGASETYLYVPNWNGAKLRMEIETIATE